MRLPLLLFALAAAPALSSAQTRAAAPGPAVGTLRELWKDITRNVSLAATEVPESLYAFKPVASVRSFGEIIGHIAGSQYNMCSVALGEPARPEDAIERTRTTKAALVQALRESSEYCDRAYAQADADAQRQTSLFGQTRTRLSILGLNAIHNGEHYGNLVTYMRINALVPPSSRPRQ